MPSVDKRVVEMQFNNKQFETGVSTTLKSLQKLKDGLNFKKATQSMNELENAGKRFNLSGVAKGVESIQQKFSALGIIGITTLANLTNQAVNAGKRIASALTIDPIRTGFQEYETQINAVQTILANTQSKGTNLKQVNAALNELNKYADMTIYNFTEMTRNIGTFTAAGVDLDTSVSAIKGIANLAAVSGSTSQQASVAMYQLSQALAAGTVKLMDWNSVVNAGMGGQVFQDALKETARVHGIQIDEMIKKEGSFRETLQKGWLTSDILTETLSKFTGDLSEAELKKMGYNEEQIKNIIKMGQTANDAATKVKTFTQLFDTLKEAAQSGWTQSWQYIIGDFEEAKGNLTRLSDYFSEIINGSAETRNAILKDWADLGGSNHLFDALIATFDAVMSFVTPLKEGFREIIPPITGQQLANVTQKLKEFAEGLKLSEENSNRVKNIGKNIANIFKPILSVLKGIAGGLPKIFEGLGSLASGFLAVIEGVTGFIGSLTQGIDLAGVFSSVLSGMGLALSAIGKGFSVLSSLVSAAINGITNFFSFLGNGFANLTSGFGSAAQGAEGVVGSSLQTIGDVVKGFFNNLKDLGVEAIKTLPELIGNVIRAIGEAISNILHSIDIKGILDLINTALLGGVLSDIRGFFKKFKETGEETEGILDKFLKGPIEKLGEVLDAVKNAINAFAMSVKINMVLKIAIAMGILAASLWTLSNIPVDSLAPSLGALATGMLIMSGVLIGVLAVLKKLGEDAEGIKNMKKMSGILRSVAISLVIFSAAIMILTKSVEALGKLSWKELVKGLGSLAIITGVLVGMTRLLKESKGLIKTAAAFVIFGVAIKILTSSVKELGGMTVKELIKGLGSLAVILGVIIGAVYGFEKAGKMSIKSAAGLLILAVAIKILSGSIKSLGEMSAKDLAKGLIGLAGSLLILIKAMDKIKISPKTAFAFVLLAAGIKTVSTSMTELGSMSIKEVAKALIALGGSMLILVKAMNSMKISPKTAASFMLFSMGLSAMIVPIKVLGDMDLLSMVQGLVGLAASLAIVTIAAKKLGSMSKQLLKTSGSLVVFGLAMIAFGIGLTAIVHPIKTLGEMGTENLIQSVGGIAVVIGAIYGLSKALEAMPKLSGKTIASLAVMVIIVGILSLILDMMSMVDTESALQAATAIAEVLLSISAALAVLSFMPIPAAMSAVGTLMAVIAAMAAVVMAAGGIAQIPGAKWLVSEGKDFLQSIGEAIGAFFGGIAGGAIEAASSSLPALGENLSGFAESAKPFFDMMSSFDPGVAEGIKNLALAFLAITGAEILDAATSWLTGGVDMAKFGEQLAEFGPHLKTFADAVDGVDGPAIEGAANAAKALADMANNLPKEGGLAQAFTGIGDMSQFGTDIVEFGGALRAYGEAVAGIDTGSIEASAGAAQALSDVANALPKSGGVFQMFTGESDLTTFGIQLVAFGASLKAYGVAVAGINAGSIKDSAEAAQGLVDVYNALDKSGGVIGFFEGEQDFSSFSSNLEGLGEGLKKYGEAVDGINPEKTKASVEVAKGLAEIKNSLGSDGGQVFNVLSGLSSALNELGPAISTYAGSLGEANFDNVGPSVEALAKVKDVVNGMNDFNPNGITLFANTIGNLGDFGLATFNEGLQSTADAVSGSMEALANSISTGAGQIGAAFDTLKSKLQAETDTYKELGKNIGLALDQGMSDGLGEGSSGPINKVKEICNQMSQAAQSSFSSVIPKFKSYGRSIAEAALSGMSGYRNRFYQAGLNMAQGVSDGINAGKYGVANAAATMASKAVEKFKSALDINSPSRVFTKIAKCIPEGAAKGIDKWTGMVEDSSKSMATTAFNVAKAAMSKVTDLVENPVPMTSSLTPVYAAGSTADISANAVLTSQLVGQLSRAVEKISNNQNGSETVVNNYDNSMNVSVDGVTINDTPAMRQATHDYLVELARLGAM